MNIHYAFCLMCLFASHASFADTPETFGGQTFHAAQQSSNPAHLTLDSSQGAERLKDVDKTQAPVTANLNKYGQNCIQGWDTFANDTPTIMTKLKSIGEDARKNVADTETRMGSPLSAFDISGTTACSGAGEKMANMLKGKIDDAWATYRYVKSKTDEVTNLQTKALNRFSGDASSQFHRSLNCPLHTPYIQATRDAFQTGSKSPKEAQQMKPNGFQVVNTVLNGFMEYLSQRAKEMQTYTDQLDQLRTNCKSAPEPYEDVRDYKFHHS